MTPTTPLLTRDEQPRITDHEFWVWHVGDKLCEQPGCLKPESAHAPAPSAEKDVAKINRELFDTFLQGCEDSTYYPAAPSAPKDEPKWQGHAFHPQSPGGEYVCAHVGCLAIAAAHLPAPKEPEDKDEVVEMRGHVLRIQGYGGKYSGFTEYVDALIAAVEKREREKADKLRDVLERIVKARELHDSACYCDPGNQCYPDCSEAGRAAMVEALDAADAALGEPSR